MADTLRDLVDNTGYDPHANTIVGVLSDGTGVALLKDADDLSKLYLYRSNVGRTNWALDKTVTLDNNLSAPFGYTIAIDGSDRVHVLYEGTQPFHTDVFYFRLTTPGTWTKSSEETCFDMTATKHPGTLALDVLDASNALFAAVLFKDLDASDAIKIRHRVRHSSGAWAGQTDHTIASANAQDGALAVCRDIAGKDGSNLQYVAVGAGANGAATYLAVARVNVTNSVLDSWTVVDAAAMGGATGRFRTIGLFPYANGEWALVGQTGAGSASTMHAARLDVADYTVEPVSKSTVYSSNGPATTFLDRTVGYAQESGQEPRGFIAFRVANANTSQDFMYGQVARFDDDDTITIGDRWVWKRNNAMFGIMSGTGKINYGLGHADVLVQANARNGPVIGVTNPTPSAPINLTPSTTAVTDIPVLTMRAAGYNAVPPSGNFDESGSRVFPVFGLARDPAFTVDAFTVTGDEDTDLILLGNKQLAVPEADELDQDTWYMRGRVTDEWGQSSAWATTVDFDVIHPPSSISHAPTGAVSVAFDATNIFSWDFYDTSPVDYQTAYQVEISRNGDFTVIEDTGKTAGDDESVAIAVDVAETEILLQWRVKLWDSDDVEGEWSDYHSFYLRGPPSVALTAPADPFDTPQPTIEWTFTPAGGRVQASWSVVIVKESTGVTVYARSGSGDTTSHLVDNASVLENASDYTFTVTVTDTAGMSVSDSLVNVTSGWDPPDQPAIVVTTVDYAEDGFVHITWDDADKDANFESYRVYRRDEENPAWVLLEEITDDIASYEYDDYLAPSGLATTYAVVQVATRFGALAESLYDTEDVTVTPQGTYYWLVDPDDSTESFVLRIVTSDEFTDDEYEEEEVHVIGLGRAIERGDRLGVKGTLSVQLRGTADKTAREQRREIKELKAQGRAMYLRTPFGDTYRINMGVIGVSRLSGVGLNEYVDITLPYSELAGASTT